MAEGDRGQPHLPAEQVAGFRGAGETAWQLRANAATAKTGVQFLAPSSGGSQPAPGDPMNSTGTHMLISTH